MWPVVWVCPPRERLVVRFNPHLGSPALLLPPAAIYDTDNAYFTVECTRPVVVPEDVFAAMFPRQEPLLSIGTVIEQGTLPTGASYQSIVVKETDVIQRIADARALIGDAAASMLIPAGHNMACDVDTDSACLAGAWLCGRALRAVVHASVDTAVADAVVMIVARRMQTTPFCLEAFPAATRWRMSCV